MGGSAGGGRGRAAGEFQELEERGGGWSRPEKKKELPYDPAIPLLGKHTEETRRERHIYPNVHRSTVYNSQDMEAT